MSEEIKQVVHMSTGRPEAGRHYAALYGAAQVELAALREELAQLRRWEQTIRENSPLVQRLTAAEQRNAELVELLRTHTDHVATLCDVMFRFGLGMSKEPEKKIYAALAQQQRVFAALKPTESGASELDPSIIGIDRMPPMEYDEFLCFYAHVQASGREPGMVNELHTSPPIVSFSDPVIQFTWMAWQARACLDKVKELNQ